MGPMGKWLIFSIGPVKGQAIWGLWGLWKYEIINLAGGGDDVGVGGDGKWLIFSIGPLKRQAIWGLWGLWGNGSFFP